LRLHPRNLCRAVAILREKDLRPLLESIMSRNKVINAQVASPHVMSNIAWILDSDCSSNSEPEVLHHSRL
jgi:hypothetical protein